MFKIGERVGLKLRDEEEYGVVIDTKNGVVSIAIGQDRIVQARERDCWLDECFRKDGNGE